VKMLLCRSLHSCDSDWATDSRRPNGHKPQTHSTYRSMRQRSPP
jgi:hypothetical protein